MGDGVRKDYFEYDDYKEILGAFGINYMPCLSVVKDGDLDTFMKIANENTYLIDIIKHPEAKGEGIVIKNYNFVNKYGRKTWAKIVLQEFKQEKRQIWGENAAREKPLVEEQIVNNFLTDEMIEKEYQKLLLINDGWRAQYIPQLLGCIYNTFINEEAWNIVKKYKNPTIDFKLLQSMVTNKIKQVKNDLF